MAHQTEKKSPLETGLTLSTLYLVLYNLVQFIGWAAIFANYALYMIENETWVGGFKHVSTILYVFQTLMVLEVVHALLGLVRSNPVLTGFQIASRVFLIWGICYLVPEVHETIGVPMFVIAWSITEMVRYSFYACNLLHLNPYILTWLRYTLFFVLYPLGVSGELLTIYSSLPSVAKKSFLEYPLPNKLNVSFSYHTYLIVVMLSYIPIFPQLYMHMINQRKKIIGGKPKTA